MGEKVPSQLKGILTALGEHNCIPGPCGKLEINTVLGFHAHNPVGHQLDKRGP